MRWNSNNYRLKFCTYTFVRPSSVECRIVSFNHISLPYPYIEIKSKNDLITDYHFNIINLGNSYTLTIIISISIISYLCYLKYLYLPILIKHSFVLKMDRTGYIYMTFVGGKSCTEFCLITCHLLFLSSRKSKLRK